MMTTKTIELAISRRTVLQLSGLLLLGLLLAAVPATSAEIIFDEACFPTCDVTDGRFLIIAGGSALATRSEAPVNLRFQVMESAVSPPNPPSFYFEIFDGDSNGCSDPGPCTPWTGVGTAHWDIGLQVPVFYTLYAVQTALDGSVVTTLVDPSKIVLAGGSVAASNPFSSTDMPNNAWIRIDVTVGNEAQATGSGDYSYLLKMELDPTATYGPNEGTLNALKVRTGESLFIGRVEQPFAFEAKWTSLDDLKIIYPNFDMSAWYAQKNAAGSTYDGKFTFFFNVPAGLAGAPQTELEIWDADLDHGSWNGAFVDSDDSDTSPDLNDLPFPAGPQITPEGANGSNPFEDQNPSGMGGLGFYNTRTPSGVVDPANPQESSVAYRLYFPQDTEPGSLACRGAGESEVGPSIIGRQSVVNLNPSGNKEWERFAVTTAPLSPQADCHADMIPSGTYQVDLIGMDMNNLNAWYFAGDVCGVQPDGSPRCPNGTLKLGDTVWLDTDLDGNGSPAEIAADGESGIAGVIVTLLDADGNSKGRKLTDANGNYEFAVSSGTYTVRVDSSNFVGPTARGVIGDRVWLDADGDGFQDSGEPGLNGVEVRLFEAGPNNVVGGGDDKMIASTRTDPNGNYLFHDLTPGDYYVVVVDATLPSGLALSGGSDPSALRTITAAEIFLDLDFGYTGSGGLAVIGDFVWHDLNSNGALDAGEPGIDGVTVRLLDAQGSTVKTTITRGGFYLFTGLAAGTYQVDVTDQQGVLTGYTLTTSNDPTAPFSVGAGAADLSRDFGYRNASLYTISDSVWEDLDRDGVKDVGESGLGGVTVALVGAKGAVLATTTTAADGSFSFAGIPDGAYSLMVTDLSSALTTYVATTQASLAGSVGANVDGANVSLTSFGYASGGALVGVHSTTLSPTQTDDVVNQNVLTYDFGYAPLGSNCAVGRPVELVLQYTGDSCSSPAANNNRQTADYCLGNLDGDEPVQFVITTKPERFVWSPTTETIMVGDTITVGSADGSFMYPNTMVELRQGGVAIQTINFHTSCSEELDPGDQFGSLLLMSYVHPGQGSGFGAGTGGDGPVTMDSGKTKSGRGGSRK